MSKSMELIFSIWAMWIVFWLFFTRQELTSAREELREIKDILARQGEDNERQA